MQELMQVERVIINGVVCWRAGGLMLPIIAGGATEGDGGGSGGQSQGNQNDGGSGSGGQQQQQQQQQQGQQQSAGKTFTQAELDQIVGDRLAREREKYKDHDDLRKKAAEFDKLQDANKSELEKASERAAKAETERDKALSAANERLVRSEVKLIATQMGIVDPDAALALMDRSGVKVNDAGDVEGVKAALDALVKVKTYLLGGTGGSGGATNPNRNRPGLTKDDINRMTPEEINSRWAEVEQVLAGA